MEQPHVGQFDFGDQVTVERTDKEFGGGWEGAKAFVMLEDRIVP